MKSCYTYIKNRGDFDLLRPILEDLIEDEVEFSFLDSRDYDKIDGVTLAYISEKNDFELYLREYFEEDWVELPIHKFHRYILYMRRLREAEEKRMSAISDMKSTIDSETKKYYLIHPKLRESTYYLNFDTTCSKYFISDSNSSSTIRTKFSEEECYGILQEFPYLEKKEVNK